MRIVVMGSGGVGGYFGARLAAAGNDVTFVARGAHLEAMREHGLRLDSELGELHLNLSRWWPTPARSPPRMPSSSRSRCGTQKPQRRACAR